MARNARMKATAALSAAILDVHRIDQDVGGLLRMLERVAVELGLARQALFVPDGAADDKSAAADTTAVCIRRPDGHVDGFLQCTGTPPEALPDLQLLAQHAGVALANLSLREEAARREEAVRRVAERLQDALLPSLPAVPHTLVDVRYRSAGREARVGGDFYDVFGLPGGRVLIVVGDVVGKGVEAASRTSRITQTLRALALQGLDLDVLLKRCDEQVTFQDPEIMATLWCGLYEPDTGELVFSSLGHPPALLLRGTDDPRRSEAVRLELEGLPLGMRELAVSEPERRSRRLGPRDLLVLYTDGVVEASGDLSAGMDALTEAVVRHNHEPLGTIVTQVLDEMLADAGHTDDAVLFLLRRR